jgi:hypothetical protein
MAAPPVSHYADDTKAPTADPDADGPVWRGAFGKLKAASGVGLYVEKTKLAPMVGAGGPAGAGGQPVVPGAAGLASPFVLGGFQSLA